MNRRGKEQGAKCKLLFPLPHPPPTLPPPDISLDRNRLLLQQRIQSPHQLQHHRSSRGYCHSDFREPVPAPTNFAKKQWTAKKSPGMLAVTDPGQMWSGVLEVKGSLCHYRPSKFPSPRGVLSWEEKPVSDHARYFLRCPAVIPEDVLQMFVFVWNIQ